MDAPATNAYRGRDGPDRTILDALRTVGRNVDALTVDELAPADRLTAGQERDAPAGAPGRAAAGSLRPRRGRRAGRPCPHARHRVRLPGHRGRSHLESYVRAGAALTARLGLARPRHSTASATRSRWTSAATLVDVVWSQNSGMNIPEKERLYAGFARVLRPGGLLALQEPMAGPVQPVVSFRSCGRGTPARASARARRDAQGDRGRRIHCPRLGRRDRGGGGTGAPAATVRPTASERIVMGAALDPIVQAGRRNRGEGRIVMIQAVLERSADASAPRPRTSGEIVEQVEQLDDRGRHRPRSRTRPRRHGIGNRQLAQDDADRARPIERHRRVGAVALPVGQIGQRAVLAGFST